MNNSHHGWHLAQLTQKNCFDLLFVADVTLHGMNIDTLLSQAINLSLDPSNAAFLPAHENDVPRAVAGQPGCYAFAEAPRSTDHDV